MGDAQNQPSQVQAQVQTPAQLADELAYAMSLLWETLAELEPEEIETAQLGGGWTPKAVVAHVAFWDDFQRRRMEAALAATSRQGFARPTHDNDLRANQDAARPWVEVQAAAMAARQQLVDFARTVPPAALLQEYPEGEHMFSVLKQLRHMVHHTQAHRREIQNYCGSMARWGRTRLRALMDAQYTDLMDGVAGLTEETMLTTQVCGDWSIRDVMAHVLSWHEYSWRVVEQWPEPDLAALQPWAWQADDNWAKLNGRLLARHAQDTVIELADGLVTYHRRLLRAFDRASDTALDGLGYAWGDGPQTLACFLYESYVHVAEHAAQIWAFRAGLLEQESAHNRRDDS